MSAIRALAREDLGALAALRELVTLGGGTEPRAGLRQHLARTTLDDPWHDPEIPSLVCVDDSGALVGFQGSVVRRALFDGRPIRIAYSSRSMTRPDVRHQALGVQLYRRFLAGPQDITLCDNATDDVRKIWALLGGRALELQCLTWTRVLRPWGAGAWLAEARRAKRLPAARSSAATLDRLTARLVPAARAPERPSSDALPIAPGELAARVSALGPGWRVRLDYSESYLEWLFRRLADVHGLGEPRARLARSANGRVEGWYVYCIRPGGSCHVLQLVGVDERGLGRVLDQLFYEAWSEGAVAVLGRLEPSLLAPLARRRAFIRSSPMLALLHGGDPELRGAITAGQALLTRLDGDWWLQDREVDYSSLAAA